MNIYTASTLEELREISILRYNVYVTEQRKSPFFIDKFKGEFFEPIDAFNESTVIYTRDIGLQQKITSSIRIERRIPDWLFRQLPPTSQYGISLFDLKACFVARAVVLEEKRGKNHFDHICIHASQICSGSYELALITCNPILVDFFMLYGYRPTGYVVQHPDEGAQRLLAMFACSGDVETSRLRFLTGNFKYELSSERRKSLFNWLNIPKT